MPAAAKLLPSCFLATATPATFHNRWLCIIGQSSLSACEVVTTGLHRISDMLGLEAKSFRSSRSVSVSEADGLIDMRTAGKHVPLAP